MDRHAPPSLTAADAAGRLERMARRWRRRRAAGYALVAASAGVLVGAGIGRTAGWSLESCLLAGATAALGAATILLITARRLRPDAALVARHLNRVHPALEESADLVLVPPGRLTLVERMQQRRVLAALERSGALAPLPERALRLAIGAGLSILVLAAALIAWPAAAERARGAAPARGGAHAGRAADAAAGIDGVAIEIVPPRYTARATQRLEDRWDVEAAEGSRITWRLTLRRPVTEAWLVTSAGDSLRFGGADEGALTVSSTATRSALYQVVLHDRDGGDGSGTEGRSRASPLRGSVDSREWTSDYHQLTVVRDGPPTLTIVRPEQRTVVAPGDPVRIPVTVLAADDYAIVSTRLVATVTTGSGEGVKFREQVLPFERTERRPAADSAGGHRLALHRIIDLAALGLGPGDDLYFHVLATDNRAPAPNEARSETVFIALADTGGAPVAELSGLAVDRLPEYFRSQRQIILDTERLLAERRRLPTGEFRDRSNNLGIDQGLLRMRYSEFLGDEFEVADAGNQADHAGEEDAGRGDPRDRPSDPTAPFRHDHDTPENATMLGASVKSKLRAAVDQMWQAELKLRTYEPKAALPYEYRALELLKEVQQDARSYVKRVGFEPPPLEPDTKRLTGTLDSIPATRTDRRRVAADQSFPAIRAAVRLLPSLRSGRTERTEATAVLEAAGRELAPLAVEAPARHLETLRHLRALIGSLDADTICGECIGAAEPGLLRALPVPEPVPGSRHGSSSLSRRYFELLEGSR